MKKKTNVVAGEEQHRTKPPLLAPVAAPTETEVEQPAAEPPAVEPSVAEPPLPFAKLFALDRDKVQNAEIEKLLLEQVAATIAKHPVAQAYNLLFLYDERRIDRGDANRIYRAASEADGKKPTLLILTSSGGNVAAAYFIAKLCREHTTAGFQVAIPREAKSAATLICCGADKIHMGSLSELGPIDPQFDGIPALALKNSVEHLAQLVATYPKASGMLSDYLAKTLQVESLGYYERVAESATHYATRLLDARVVGGNPSGRDNASIARKLVYEYKDHGFVVDSREAIDIFGGEVVMCNSPEYKLANELYESLDLLKWICENQFKRGLAFTGGLSKGCWLYPLDRRN